MTTQGKPQPFYLVGGWATDLKICSSNWIISPGFGVKIKKSLEPPPSSCLGIMTWAVPPAQDASHHRGYLCFSDPGSRTKHSFATVTGGGTTQIIWPISFRGPKNLHVSACLYEVSEWKKTLIKDLCVVATKLPSAKLFWWLWQTTILRRMSSLLTLSLWL